MFVNKKQEVPNIFNAYVDFAKKIDSRYNQMVVNWYNKEDHIEMHRDCTSKMIKEDAPILTINLNESDLKENEREMIFQNVKTNKKHHVPLVNNNYYIINNNTTHRHGVGKGNERRISLTFRMIK